jgi:Flp pilus assembly protein TadG
MRGLKPELEWMKGFFGAIDGLAAIEFANAAPVLIAILIPLVDLGRQAEPIA